MRKNHRGLALSMSIALAVQVTALALREPAQAVT
jgi:hypothetical protein